jgi:hypothetical protein
MVRPNMVPNMWNKEGWASERCAKCGMIFTVLSQDCRDEITARQRLTVALVSHWRVCTAPAESNPLEASTASESSSQSA